ncbi:ATP-binding protein [Vulgatibacter sp.]|uniref:ATP-binding protein n=1 Tax=Vulgatibacter sp. TaxID=1971226 RepID=UPI00356A2C17
MRNGNEFQPRFGLRLLAGAGLGLIGLALNAFPIELLPGVHLLPGLLAVPLAAILLGPAAGLVAGLLATASTVLLWGHPWGMIGFGLEGLVLGWLSRRMVPVVADLLWWLVGIGYLYVTYALIIGVSPSQAAVVVVKQVLNSLLAVLAVQGLLLLPTIRRRVRDLLPPSLRNAGFSTGFATALAFAAGLPLLLLAAQEGRDRYLQEFRELALRNRADARVAAVAVEKGVEAALRGLTVLADELADEARQDGGALADRARLQRRLEALVAHSPEVLNAHVGDAAGFIVAFEPPVDADGRVLAGRDFSDQPEVREILAGGGSVVTGIFASRLGGGLPVVVIATPIEVDGAVRGYVSGAVSFHEVLERASVALAPSQRLRLVDEDGASVVRRGPGDYLLESLVDRPLRTAVQIALRTGGMGAFVGEAGEVALTRAEQTLQLGAAAVERFGWTVVVSQPQSAVASRIQRAYLGLLALVGFAILLVVLAAVAFIPLLVGPVRSISATAARLARGERDARVGSTIVDAPREIHQLGADFDRMADELSRQLEAVEAASRAKDEFLSIASHELKTPMTALKTQVQLLRRRLPAEQQERLEKLDRQVDRLTRLVNQLLDASRVGVEELALQPAPCDLAEIARRVAVGLVSEAAGFELRLTLEPAVGRWDELRIEQVVYNLVANAVKYSPGGGLIEVRVRPTEAGGARLEVADRGMGLAAGAEPLFERFSRGVEGTNLAGLGVGLYVAREIVLRHGGTIGLAAREGGGAVATVRLPATIPGDAARGEMHPGLS